MCVLATASDYFKGRWKWSNLMSETLRCNWEICRDHDINLRDLAFQNGNKTRRSDLQSVRRRNNEKQRRTPEVSVGVFLFLIRQASRKHLWNINLACYSFELPSLRGFMINLLSSNLREHCSLFSWSRVHHCGLPRSQIYKLNIIQVVFSDKLLVCVFSPTTFFGRLRAAFELSWEVYFVHNRRNFVFRRAPPAKRSDQEGISYTI